jgi:DNA-binding response OmpR family regulator
LADAAPPRVAVVHADAVLRSRLADALIARGHAVVRAPRVDPACDRAAVVVVDHRALPLATPARLLALVPDRDEVEIRAAFARGADDVLTGSRRPAEHATRVARLLSRPAVPPRRWVGPLEIDAVARRVTLAGRPLELTRREYELLAQLAAAPGRVFTKQELLRAIWALPAGSPGRRLDTHVARLRRRLGDHRALLVTVWGVGYRLGCPDRP